MDLELFVTKGLGNNSYLVISGKEAAMVDPQRDIWRFTNIIDERDLRLKFVAETHVHNDYISGALELKDRYNSGRVELALPAKGDYEYEHRKMEEGDTLKLGKLEFKVINSPGHTYEHISWIVSNGDDIKAAFTGGSLMIGSAGRTDLLGPDHVNELTKLQYESIMRLKEFPVDMSIYPTHGSGSFCASSNPSKERISVLGSELIVNQALTANSVEEFFNRQLSDLKQYPRYYAYMAPINRQGPKVYGGLPMPHALTLEEFQEKMEEVVIVDIRTGKDFAKQHIPNSYNFEYASSMGNYIGWILEFNQPMLVVSDDPVDAKVRELTTQLFRIGYEQILGYLQGGFDTWLHAQLPTTSYSTVDAREVQDSIEVENVLDVRDPVEFKDVHLKNSKNVFVGDLENLSTLERKDWYVMCVSGQRAASAASLLKKHDLNPILVTNGGIEELKGN